MLKRFLAPAVTSACSELLCLLALVASDSQLWAKLDLTVKKQFKTISAQIFLLPTSFTFSHTQAAMRTTTTLWEIGAYLSVFDLRRRTDDLVSDPGPNRLLLPVCLVSYYYNLRSATTYSSQQQQHFTVLYPIVPTLPIRYLSIKISLSIYLQKYKKGFGLGL